MNAIVKSVIETVRRSGDFLDRNDQLFAAINASEARKDLTTAGANLAAHADDQATGHMQSMGETTKQHDLRTTLRVQHMAPIAAIARAKLTTVGNFSSLTLPDARLLGGPLVAYANAMATAAEAYSSVFVAQARPVDFIAQFRAATAALNTSLDTRNTSRGQGVRGTVGLNSAMSAARKTLKVLDKAVVPLLQNDDALLAEWRSARHILRRPVPAASTKASGSAASPTQPATGTAATTTTGTAPAAAATPAAITPTTGPADR